MTRKITTILHAVLLSALLAFGAVACDDEKKPAPPTPEPSMDPNPDDDPNPDMPCPQGTADCPCGEGDTCDDGLVCEMGTCKDVDEMNLAISDPNARSCEIYIQESTAKVLGATFGDGVKGKLLRREPGVAISFFREGDDAFPAGSIALQVDGPEDGFSVRTVTCYDRDGGTLNNVEITF